MVWERICISAWLFEVEVYAEEKWGRDNFCSGSVALQHPVITMHTLKYQTLIVDGGKRSPEIASFRWLTFQYCWFFPTYMDIVSSTFLG